MSALQERIAALSPEQREALLVKLRPAPTHAPEPTIARRSATGPLPLSFAQHGLGKRGDQVMPREIRVCQDR